MGEAEFSWSWVRGTTHQPHIADGVMGGPKRTGRTKGTSFAKQPADTMNLCGFDGLFHGEGRHDRCNAFGQHRFSTSRRTEEKEAVVPGNRHLNRPPDMVLAFDLGKIQSVW